MATDRNTFTRTVPFEEYFRYVETRPTLINGVQMRDLTPTALGLDLTQLNCLMAVARTYDLIERTHSRDRGINTVLIPREGILALATLIGLGFDNLAYGKGNDQVTNAGAHFPKVEATIRNVRASLGFYPDILRWYPNLREYIQDPKMPRDENKRVGLSPKLFTPKPIIYAVTNKGTSGGVSELERASQYGTVRYKIHQNS